VLPNGGTGNAGWPIMTNRAGYDTIGDYNGYTDSTSSLKSLSGQTLSVARSGELYTRKVTVTSGVRPIGHTVAPAGDLVLVKVTVTPPVGSSVTLLQLFTRTDVSR
jgi:hypothetical protein